MAKEVERKFEDCLKKGKIKKLSGANKLTKKELKVAHGDFEVAKDGLAKSQWKWCTIQAYYSMFHTARALLYSVGYREKSHYCLIVALEALFVTPGMLSERYVDAFHTAKTMRENADYEETFSENGARKLVTIAEEFLKEAKSILGIKF